MNLISCRGCGCVLDKDRLYFPDSIYDDEGDINEDKAQWNGDEWVVAVECPVCQCKILEKD